ncbi:MAG: amidase [Nitrospirae bacterium]|nr:amidase [Nitrospirota bacterium]
MKSLLVCSGRELADLIRRRKVSSSEVVEAHIRRIEEVNPKINAVVVDRFEQARTEAGRADRRLGRRDRDSLPPFFGVPCTIKECFAFAGMPQTSGLVARKGRPASADCPTVARLRHAGAIPLGLTNLSELCMWMESNNKVYGRTRNPYDPGRIAGGSSGGEGAIIGAGGSPFGLGADVGGSIRMPAFFNGVFGHKPTGTAVPSTGHYPEPENDIRRYNCVGPLARRAGDLMPLLRILAGPDGIDPYTRRFRFGDPTKVKLRGLRVLDVPENGAASVSDDLREAQEKCARWLAGQGARVETLKLDGLRDSIEIWAAMMSAAGGPTFSELLGNGTPVRAGWELLKWMLGRSEHTFPAIGLALLEKLPQGLEKRARRAVEKGRALRQELLSRLGKNAVMLYPSYPEPAPRHNRPLWPPIRWAYTAIINVMELPSTQVPLGLNAQGLPLGVQVIGGTGQDHLTIGTALRLEEAFGGWVPPPGG